MKKVLVHEVSHLARHSSIAHRFVESLEDAGVSLYWHQQGIETLLENGKRNPAAAIMLALLAKIVRSKRETLIERINSGLSEARHKGRTLGRPKGSAMLPKDGISKHKDIAKFLNQGVHSLRQIVNITGKSKLIPQRVKAAWGGHTLSY